jgi:hypothetical protein
MSGAKPALDFRGQKHFKLNPELCLQHSADKTEAAASPKERGGLMPDLPLYLPLHRQTEQAG